MIDDYFNEFETGVLNAYKVTDGNWILYDGLLPVVLDENIPSDPFRLAIIISAVTDHTTVAGTVTINDDEEIEFSRATRLTSSEALTDLPTITAEGLDCNIRVECISVAGAPLKKEVLVPIEIICFPKTHILRDRSGSGWQQTTYDIYSRAQLVIGDHIRFTDPHQGAEVDLYVENVASAVDLELGNTQPFRVYNCA